MKTSDQINELAGALAKAQGQISPAPKDRENPFFKSHYSTLASCWEACRDALAENGLAVVQPAHEVEHGVVVTTRLIHSSGQWIEDDLLMPVRKADDAQAFGSAYTYGRRYGLCGMVGIVPESDDDGNSAADAGNKSHNERKPARKPDPPPGMTTGDKIPTPAKKPSAKRTFAEVLAEATGFEDLKTLLTQIDKKDADLAEKVPMYRDTYRKILDGEPTREQASWLNDSIQAKRQVGLIDQDTYMPLIEAVDKILDAAAQAA